MNTAYNVTAAHAKIDADRKARITAAHIKQATDESLDYFGLSFKQNEVKQAYRESRKPLIGIGAVILFGLIVGNLLGYFGV